MHISKLLAVICVSAIGTTSLLAQRPDNDVQTRARQQLREAMGELNGQPATNSVVTPAPVSPAKPMPAPAPTQPMTAPVKPMVAPQAQPMPVQARRPGGLSPEAEMRAREALHQATAQTDMQMPDAGMAMPPAGTKSSYANMPSTMPNPMPAPASTLSGSKQQRLDQLKQLYVADQLTPNQYHEQRAKILAEP